MVNLFRTNTKCGGIQYTSHRYTFVVILMLYFVSLYGQEKKISVSHNSCGLKVKNKRILNSRIPEGSGLVAWNGKLWTHNDSGRPTLFSLDTINYKIVQEYDLGIVNTDCEEISQDSKFLYIGNFGNNLGNRDKLEIYRISKEMLLQNNVVLDSITFEWPMVNNSGISKKINYDCEAMVLANDTIFLFTKEWKKPRRSQIFKIPALPGNYIAEYVSTIKTRTLITGATYRPEDNRIVLCGYSMFLSPRIITLSLSETKNLDVYKAHQIRINQYLRQTEGVASFNGTDYFIISEGINLWFWKNRPKLYKVKIPFPKK